MTIAPASIPGPDSGMTDEAIIDALLTRLTSTDHISALAHEVKIKAESEAMARYEADSSVGTAEYDALAAQLQALISWAYDRPQAE
jgi:hypothetical protein